jgi:nucleotide-binding universal stress UspA family protein
MPLLREAGSVTAVLVNQPIRRAGESSQRGDDLLQRLGHYGIDARSVHVTSEEKSTADALGAEVARLNADLLVMGAQADGGFRRWFLGSVSREIINDTKLPLLIAH